MSTGKIAVRYAKALFLAAREHEVLDKVKSLNNGPLADEALETLYRVIIETCLAFQKTMETDA